MAERILVIGGTGMLGEPVAWQLQAVGYQVRILTRSPQNATARLGKSYRLAVGDVDNLSLLEAALQGCDGVHISLDGGKDYDLEHHDGVNVAGAAVKAALPFFRYFEHVQIKGSPAEANALLRAPTITLEIWSRQQANHVNNGR